MLQERRQELVRRQWQEQQRQQRQRGQRQRQRGQQADCPQLERRDGQVFPVKERTHRNMNTPIPSEVSHDCPYIK